MRSMSSKINFDLTCFKPWFKSLKFFNFKSEDDETLQQRSRRIITSLQILNQRESLDAASACPKESEKKKCRLKINLTMQIRCCWWNRNDECLDIFYWASRFFSGRNGCFMQRPSFIPVPKSCQLHAFVSLSLLIRFPAAWRPSAFKQINLGPTEIKKKEVSLAGRVFILNIFT